MKSLIELRLTVCSHLRQFKTWRRCENCS